MSLFAMEEDKSVLEIETAQDINSLLLLLPVTEVTEEEAVKYIRKLRNSCCKGYVVQNILVSHQQFIEFLQSSICESDNQTSREYSQVCLALWQLLANTVVSNEDAQINVWSKFGDIITKDVVLPSGKITDIQLMIMFNIFKGKRNVISDVLILRLIVQLWNNIVKLKCSDNFEYLHFFFEHFLVGNRFSVKPYAQLNPDERIGFLNYMSIYIQNQCPNGEIGSFLLKHISKEFKIKSDCILRCSAKGIDELGPREAYALLQIIAMASGDARYSEIYNEDHALFLNVSSLLRCLVAFGKENSESIFTPMNKLEEVAPASNLKRDFENYVSFELKTLLVRSIANMLFKNKVNVGYCLDTQLIPTLLECTNMDARNPLVKEWSILALRNACMESCQVQEIIANLTNHGIAENDLLKDLNMGMGSLRIQSNLQ